MSDIATQSGTDGETEATSSSSTACSPHSDSVRAYPSVGKSLDEYSSDSVDDVRDLLLHITREMVGAQDSAQLLQTIVDAALRIVPSAAKCVIHLLDASGTTLQARVCSEPSPVQGGTSGMPANVGVAGRALREKALICVNDIGRSPDFAPLRSGSDLRSLLVAPLYVQDIPLGTLSLNSNQPAAFSETDCQHVRTLAAQASAAIHQANLLLEAVIQRERSDAIVESISDGLAILDSAGCIVRINPALLHMLELSSQDIELPHKPGALCPRLCALLEFPSSEPTPYEVELDLPSGTRVILRVTRSPLRPPASGTVLAVRDITPERTAAEAQALFISQVSHELRTPLQHILSFVSLINDIDDLSPADHQRFLGHIEYETYHLARLVDDLVQLSRIKTGRFAIYTERVCIDELVSGIISRLEPRAQIAELSLSLDNLSEPTWIIADPLRFEQVLVNLVENAFKYVPQGGHVQVSVARTEIDVTVQVSDTGPGIAPEVLPLIFDSFYQVESGGQSTGLGLGLYISKQIIEALDGEIWAESQVGEGSTFSFRLPRVPPDASAR